MNSVDRARAWATAERAGEHLLADLPHAWKKLETPERQLLELMIAANSQSCVGQCENALLKNLVARGFLQLPIGVRLILLQDLETVFSIPESIWKEFQADPRQWLVTDKEHLKQQSQVLLDNIKIVNGSNQM